MRRLRASGPCFECLPSREDTGSTGQKALTGTELRNQTSHAYRIECGARVDEGCTAAHVAFLLLTEWCSSGGFQGSCLEGLGRSAGNKATPHPVASAHLIGTLEHHGKPQNPIGPKPKSPHVHFGFPWNSAPRRELPMLKGPSSMLFSLGLGSALLNASGRSRAILGGRLRAALPHHFYSMYTPAVVHMVCKHT